MTTKTDATIAVLALAALLACGERSDPRRGTPETSEAAPVTGASDNAVASGGLQAIMLALERDMAGVAHGVWRTDYGAVASSAASIAGHPEIPPGERERIAATLGGDMEAFGRLDSVVHDGALRMRGAAEREDLIGVLEAWQSTQDGCVACHQGFRGRLAPVLSGDTPAGR